MIRPYNRSWRLVAALCLAAVLFLPLHHHAVLSERQYYREVMIPGIRSFFGGMVYNNTLYGPGKENEVHQQWNFSNPCAGFPDTDGILLVMKTGATEAFEKMPTQLLTSLQCLPDFLLFSDLVSSTNVFAKPDAPVVVALISFHPTATPGTVSANDTFLAGAANRAAPRLRRPRGRLRLHEVR